MLLLAMVCHSEAQEPARGFHQGETFELCRPLPNDDDHAYTASNHIKLHPGFKSKPDEKTTTLLNLGLDEYGIYPPDNGQVNDSGNVVGSLDGVVNIGAMGGLNYTIPIELPKGINGMQPNISIVYSSQGGNGLLGWGWDLGAGSRITRTGQTIYHDGQLTAANLTKNDRFVLDGQRLMVVDGDYGMPGSEYKTENDCMSKIKYYRAIILESRTYFKVWDKMGNLLEYHDRLCSPDGSKEIMWMLSSVTDRYGNTIEYNYITNNETGETRLDNIEYTANSRHHVEAQFKIQFHYSTNRDDYEKYYIGGCQLLHRDLLERITVTQKGTGKPLCQYQFNYIKEFFGPNDQLYCVLSSIGMKAYDVDGSIEKFNSTKINWDGTHPLHTEKHLVANSGILANFPFMGDFNGDGYTDLATVPYKTSGNDYYSEPVDIKIYLNDRGCGFARASSMDILQIDSTLDWIYTLDINGDGLDDIVTVLYENNNGSKHTSVKVYENSPTDQRFHCSATRMVPNQAELLVGDFDGNTTTDVIVLEKRKELEHINVGTCSHCVDTVHYVENAFFVGYQESLLQNRKLNESSLKVPLGPVFEAAAVDYDGDGICEAFLVGNQEDNIANHTTKLVRFNLNDQEHCFSVIQSLNKVTYHHGTNTPWCYVFPGDFNGDGKTDVLYYESGWGICFSDGNLYHPYDFSNGNSEDRLPNIGYYRNIFFPSLRLMDKVPGDMKLMFNVADLDGDGCSDICFTFEGNHMLFVASRVEKVSTNSLGFRRKKSLDIYFGFRSQFTHVGNFLGRDNASILESIQPPNDSKTANAYIVSPASVNRYNSMASITDGLGNATRFTYDYLMPKNVNAEDGFYSFSFQVPDQYGIHPVPLPVLALKTCEVKGVNGSSVIDKYSYADAYYHKYGHGFMGFGQTVTETYRNSIESAWKTRKVCQNGYGTMWPYAMMLPKKEFTYTNEDGVAKLVNLKTFNFMPVRCQITGHPRLVVCPAMTWKQESVYSMDDSHQLIKTILTEYEYTFANGLYQDAYGCSQTHQTIRNHDGVNSVCELETITRSGQSTFADTWIVNRPDWETVDLIRNGETKSTRTEYSYEGNTIYEANLVTYIPNDGSQPYDPLTTITHYGYDVFGNNTDVLLEAPYGILNEQQREIHYQYGQNYHYRLITQETKGAVSNGYSTTFQYDFHDRLSSATDCNGMTIQYESSPLGVVQKTFPIDGTEQRTVTLWAKDSPYKPDSASYYTWSKKTGGVTTMTFYHKSGLELRSVTFGFDGTPIFADKRYNDEGLLEMESIPYRQGEPEENLKWTTYTYDDKDRLLSVVYPDGTVKSMKYQGLQTTTTTTPTEGEGQKTVSILNAMGWPKENIDAVGSQNPTSVYYEYYPDGNLKWTRIGNDETTTIRLEYDHAGNRTLLHDPDYCTTTADLTSVYNAFGEEVSTTTPKGLTTTFLYDQLGRMTQRTEEETAAGGGTETRTTVWTYNEDVLTHQKGLLQSITYPGQTVSYTYDGCQRLQGETVAFAQNESYTTSYTYDPASRKESVQYPSGFTTYYHYNSIGHLKSIEDADGNVLYRTRKTNPLGHIERYRLGENIVCDREYHPEKQLLANIRTTKGEIILQDLSYEYDGFSNLASRTDNKRNLEESFTYDHLNRLTGIWLNNSRTGWMNYDAYGRMTGKITDNTLVFSGAVYDETAKPHAIDYAEVDAGSFSGHSLTYTCFDKVKTITQGNNTLEYTYGYDRQRVFMEEHINGMERTKRYVGNCEFVAVTENNATTERVLTYLTGPMGVFAVVETSGNEDTLHYILKDHLGSWTTITDSQGNVEQELSFDAWGTRRNPEIWHSSSQLPDPMFDRGFTGHEHLYAFGLINMNGRMYDPQMSSFLSVDAYVQSPDNSQSFNRYAYCLNNPLKYTDPSGWVMQGGMTPSNPYHENWGVNFAEKAYTTVEVKQMLWSKGVSTENWMMGNEMHGGGGGDDGKPKAGDKSKQAKDAYNYSNGVATLIGGAAKNAELSSKISNCCSALSIVGIIYNIYLNYTSYDKGEITFYSFCARTNNSIGEYALTKIPHGIGIVPSVVITAVDISGGFDNNIYNEEWMKGALNEMKSFISPQRSNNEPSPIIYYRHGW